MYIYIITAQLSPTRSLLFSVLLPCPSPHPPLTSPSPPPRPRCCGHLLRGLLREGGAGRGTGGRQLLQAKATRIQSVVAGHLARGRVRSLRRLHKCTLIQASRRPAALRLRGAPEGEASAPGPDGRPPARPAERARRSDSEVERRVGCGSGAEGL